MQIFNVNADGLSLNEAYQVDFPPYDNWWELSPEQQQHMRDIFATFQEKLVANGADFFEGGGHGLALTEMDAAWEDNRLFVFLTSYIYDPRKILLEGGTIPLSDIQIIENYQHPVWDADTDTGE